MDITAEAIEDTFRYGGSLELPNGDIVTRHELHQYIAANEIDTSDDGTPLDDQWQLLADVLGAPNPGDVSELVAVTKAAERLVAAEKERDDLIRAALTAGHPVIAVGRAADLSRARIYQIRDRRR